MEAAFQNGEAGVSVLPVFVLCGRDSQGMEIAS